MKRRWRLLGLLAGAFIFCSVGALVFAANFASPADAREPYPGSELISAESVNDLRGAHTVRKYRAPARMQIALEWYYGEGVVPRFARNNPNLHCVEHRFIAPAPRLPVPFWVLSRFTETTLCAEGETTLVTAETYYTWQYIGP